MAPTRRKSRRVTPSQQGYMLMGFGWFGGGGFGRRAVIYDELARIQHGPEQLAHAFHRRLGGGEIGLGFAQLFGRRRAAHGPEEDLANRLLGRERSRRIGLRRGELFFRRLDPRLEFRARV